MHMHYFQLKLKNNSMIDCPHFDHSLFQIIACIYYSIHLVIRLFMSVPELLARQTPESLIYLNFLNGLFIHIHLKGRSCGTVHANFGLPDTSLLIRVLYIQLGYKSSSKHHPPGGLWSLLQYQEVESWGLFPAG